MGCCHSRLEKEESVSRCKARLRYMKHLVRSRHAFAAAHTAYLRSLRSSGAALLQFANGETQLRHPNHPTLLTPSPSPPPPAPPPPRPTPPFRSPPLPRPPHPPMSPSSDMWNSSITASPILPPPPPPASSSWDFWDPFAPSSSRSVTEEEWEEAGTSVSEVTVAPAVVPPPSVVSGYSKDSTSELAMVVVPRGRKELSEIVKDLDEYFLKAADSGSRVSFLLEAPRCGLPSTEGLAGKVYSYGRSLSPLLWSRGSNSKSNGFIKFGRLGHDENALAIGDGARGDVGMMSISHSSTVEKLYAWEKKLYLEIKSSERTKMEHGRRVSLVRKQEAKGVDYVKVEKNRREIERLESKMMVASQAMGSTSSEIIRLREAELFPQLLELVNGLMCMWRSMYECHQVQTHIVQQLEYLNSAPSTNPTSNMHREATLQLEFEIEHWHSAFCNLVKSQRDYIHALVGWLRLSLLQCHHDSLTKTQQNSEIYSLCEEWQLALDRIPDKVASEGIKSFLTVIHAVVVQQAEEHKQKKRSESSFKELEKRMTELRSLEGKYGPYSMSESHVDRGGRTPVIEKRVKVEALKAKAEDEKSKHEKSSGVTRAMTLNNLQTGFPNVFQAMTGFASVCMQAFESAYNHRCNSGPGLDLKRLLP